MHPWNKTTSNSFLTPKNIRLPTSNGNKTEDRKKSNLDDRLFGHYNCHPTNIRQEPAKNTMISSTLEKTEATQ